MPFLISNTGNRRLIPGQRTWTLVFDDRGHRDYKLTLRVRTDDPKDGPWTILQTPGLPVPGSLWKVDNDFDPWVWCRRELSVIPDVEDEPNKHWTLEFLFSNRPQNDCAEDAFDDPLLIPPKVSGGTIRYTEEAQYDMFGAEIVNSAWERIRGPQVEFDKARLSIRIEQNVPALNLEFTESFLNKVNDATLWGFAPRKVKLSNWTWEKRFSGHCDVYYNRVLEFETNRESFDRTVLDEGTKVLKGHWSNQNGNWILEKIKQDNGAGIIIEVDPSRFDPSHFIRFRDRANNYARVILNGAGLPASVGLGTGTGTATTGAPGKKTIYYYPEANFALLGIPLVL